MRHLWSLEGVKLQNAWLTIGMFDGIHRGHQAIIRKLTAGAHEVGSPAVVLTFNPHPAYILGKRKLPFYLTTPEERATLLGDLGVDVVITYPFDRQLANNSADEFISRLKASLDIKHLMIGPDFALGRHREGDVAALRRLGEQYGYSLEVLPKVNNNSLVISSSRIRTNLIDGNVELAATLLGRPYRINGEVIPGDGRGHLIGIPTANLKVWMERAIPKAGVYVCRVLLDGEILGAVTNVGIRPTFETKLVPARIEVYILDFEKDLYGKNISLDFITRLRDEQRFVSAQALVDQIHYDIKLARKILNNLA